MCKRQKGVPICPSTAVTMNQQAVLDDDQAVLGLFDKYCELLFRFLENRENPCWGLKPNSEHVREYKSMVAKYLYWDTVWAR